MEEDILTAGVQNSGSYFLIFSCDTVSISPHITYIHIIPEIMIRIDSSCDFIIPKIDTSAKTRQPEPHTKLHVYYKTD